MLSPPEQAAAELPADDAHGLREFLHGPGPARAVTEETIVRFGTPDVIAAVLARPEVPLADMAAVGPVTVPKAFRWSDGPGLTEAIAHRCAERVTGTPGPSRTTYATGCSNPPRPPSSRSCSPACATGPGTACRLSRLVNMLTSCRRPGAGAVPSSTDCRGAVSGLHHMGVDRGI